MQDCREPQTFSQRMRGGRQVIHQAPPQGGLRVHQQAPYQQQEEASPPLWTPTSWDQIESLSLRLTREKGVRGKQQEIIEALKGEIRELQHKAKLERCEGCEKVFLQMNMGDYSNKTKEELIGVISAQNDIIIEKETPTTLKEEDIHKLTKWDLARANHRLDLQMQGVMTVLKAQEAANKAMEQEMAELKKHYIGETTAAPFSLEEKVDDAQDMAGVQELQDQVTSLKNKLEDERQRASTLQQEQEEMSMFEEKISKDREQVQKLNAEKLSLEEQVKKLQEDVYSRAMEGSKNTEKIQELNDIVSSLSNQLEEAKHQLLEKNKQELQLDERMEEERDILKTTVDDLLPETSKLEDQEETSNAICEDIREPFPELDSTLVDSEGDDSNTVKETPGMISTTPEVITETPEMEAISLWRRFKKSVTPKHRRQYKRQRQRQD
ncbi:golgin subfamily A member 5-like [Xyrichtys novacula]|uniref:Golgin subfamily A member 5-like n=1 Tax=Xyrichtys novacula TaxID=13765 RepID=A0AAV1H7H0_XYRNO|nr:golgin subfamily A member 5-like [Xyrichtys novacula]